MRKRIVFLILLISIIGCAQEKDIASSNLSTKSNSELGLQQNKLDEKIKKEIDDKLKNGITNKNVQQLNDYAYELEKNNNLEESKYLLEKILEKYPDRVVANLNYGDVLWKLNKKEESEIYYDKYIRLMVEEEKEDKIPETLINKFIIIPQYKYDKYDYKKLVQDDIFKNDKRNLNRIGFVLYRNIDIGYSEDIYFFGIGDLYIYDTEKYLIIVHEKYKEGSTEPSSSFMFNNYYDDNEILKIKNEGIFLENIEFYNNLNDESRGIGDRITVIDKKDNIIINDNFYSHLEGRVIIKINDNLFFMSNDRSIDITKLDSGMWYEKTRVWYKE